MPMVAVITLVEVAAACCPHWGCSRCSLPGTGRSRRSVHCSRSLAILMLFFGQRMAKDYTGAAALIPYFILASSALCLGHPLELARKYIDEKDHVYVHVLVDRISQEGGKARRGIGGSDLGPPLGVASRAVSRSASRSPCTKAPSLASERGVSDRQSVRIGDRAWRLAKGDLFSANRTTTLETPIARC